MMRRRQYSLPTRAMGLGVAVMLAGCAGTPSQSELDVTPAQQLAGTSWTAERILDKPAGIARSTLEFKDAGTVGGSTGCNNYTGSVIINASTLEFGPLASTRMLCEPAINGQETVFLEALELTRSWQQSGKVLELTDADGSVVMIMMRD